MCEGRAPELEEKTSFIGRWMDILRPKFPAVADIEKGPEQARAFEHLAVLTSLENLMSFPFVASAVEEGTLALHGLWTDIGEGGLSCYDPNLGVFKPV